MLPVWSMKKVAWMIAETQKQKFDAVIAVTGARGLGKSALAYKLSKGVGRYNKNKFIPKRDIVFSRDDVIKQLANKKWGIIDGDEFVNVTYNRDFAKKDQQTFLKMLNMYRDSRNCLFACIPDFPVLDKQFRGLVKMRLQVIRRGAAIIHLQRPTSYSIDPWDMKNNEKVEAGWSKGKGKGKPNYGQLTTAVGMVMYGDITKRERREYELIKQTKRQHLVDNNGKEKTAKKKDNIYDKFIDRLDTGKVTSEDLNSIAFVYDVEPSSFRTNLAKRLRRLRKPPLSELLCPLDSSL